MLEGCEAGGGDSLRPLLFPIHRLMWRPPDPTDAPAASIHRLFLLSAWHKRSLWGRLQTAFGLLSWPILAVATAIVVTAANGRRIRLSSGRGAFRQFADQLRLAFSAGVLPPWYYIFDLHDRQLRRQAGEYLHRYELKRALYTVVRRVTGTFGDSTLTDKARFHRECRRAGLPTARLVFAAADGQLDWLAPAGSLPEQDLFAKPTWGRGGFGAQLWRHVGEGRWERAGRRLEAAQFAERFRLLSCILGYIVEERLTNHPALAELSCGALATVRVLTILDERGEPEVTNAVFRMPARAGKVVDNFHAGGIAAAVDLDTGTLGPATNFDLLGRAAWHDRHPLTQATITGRPLPHWPAVLDLARQAHEVFRRFVVVGWDIAILADGPCLVEGNSAPDLDLIQRPSRAPLGNSRFGRLFAQHLDRAWRLLPKGF